MAAIAALPPLSTLLQEGRTPEELLAILLSGVESIPLESTELFFRCGCSKEKVARALISFGKEELGRMAEEDEGATVTCEFCRQQYRFERSELETLIAE
jgi:molecular chaperone Hsp33